MSEAPVISRMFALITKWERESDQRAVFLRCYALMTKNMLDANQSGEFIDPAWVDLLLHHFSEYYFRALEAYESPSQSAPAVWQVAHDSAREARVSTLQKMILGVNAHINYDLVFTLVELLEGEWAGLSEARRSVRHSDYCKVNDIIGQTIDAVQDQILEPRMPLMVVIDQVFGTADEWMISKLISTWRETVWQNSVQLMETAGEPEKAKLILQVEHHALRRASAIELKDWSAVIDEIF